jgi:hypothetical protein
MSMVMAVAEPRDARPGRPARPPCDLIVLDLPESAPVRRALRALDCVRSVVSKDGECRVWADPGSAPAVTAALRAQGVALAVVTLPWSRGGHGPTARPAAGRRLTRALTRMIVITAAPCTVAAARWPARIGGS